MRCHTVILTISLSVGVLDSLHDPSAYVAPHDISDAAVPVNEHSLPPPPPPGFFPSPRYRASAVERDITFAPVPSDSSEQSQVPWSIQGPASVADSSPGSQVPEVEIPQVDVECFLSRTHICQALYSMHAGTSAVSPKPMLTGTHIWASAILGEWRHPRIPHHPHFEM